MFVFSFIVGGVGLFMERGGQAILFPACGGRCEDDVFKIQTKSRTKADSPTVNAVIVEVADVNDDRRSAYVVAGGTKPPITILLVTFRITDDSLRRAIAGKLRFA